MTKELEGRPAGGGGQRSWHGALLVLLVLLTFGRLLGCDFTWFDDRGTVSQNPRLNPPTWAGLGYYWRHPYANLYTPVTYTVWAALAAATWVPTPDAQGIHLDPHVFHAANILVHAASAWFVYRLLLLLLRPARRPWAAFAGAALFALHPLQVESVGWVSGLKDVLAGCLGLAALLMYVHSALAGSSRSRRAWFIAATLCYVAAMLSKASALCIPLVAAVIDAVLLRRPWRRWAGPLACWVVLSLPVAIIGRAAQVTPGAFLVPRWFRPLLAGDCLAFYLEKLVAPVRLCIEYDLRPHHMVDHTWAYVAWLAPLGVAGLIAVSRSRWLIAAGLCFLAGLLPVLGLTPIFREFYSAVADHYAYIALLGPAIAMTAFLAGRGARWRFAIAAVVLLALAARTIDQCGTWAGTVPLMEHAIAANPRTIIPRTILAGYLENADPERAIAENIACFDTDPVCTNEARLATGMLIRRGEFARAIDLVQRVIETERHQKVAPPSYSECDWQFTLAMLFERVGRRADAAAAYQRVLECAPSNILAWEGLQRTQSRPTVGQ